MVYTYIHGKVGGPANVTVVEPGVLDSVEGEGSCYSKHNGCHQQKDLKKVKEWGGFQLLIFLDNGIAVIVSFKYEKGWLAALSLWLFALNLFYNDKMLFTKSLKK